MKNLLFLFVLLGLPVLLLGQTITVDAGCLGGELTYTLDMVNSPDGSGRNVYIDPAPEGSNSGTSISYNTRSEQWEIVGFGFVLYVADYTSSPNPPDSGTATWEESATCSGTGGAAMVSGDGTQDNVGGDPCMAAGGDDDMDGVCNPDDICEGFDDNIDPDMDGFPSGCDEEPNTFNGVTITASCISMDPEQFVLVDTDGSNNNVFFNANTGLTISVIGGFWTIGTDVPDPDYVFATNASGVGPNPPENGWTVQDGDCPASDIMVSVTAPGPPPRVFIGNTGYPNISAALLAAAAAGGPITILITPDTYVEDVTVPNGLEVSFRFGPAPSPGD